MINGNERLTRYWVSKRLLVQKQAYEIVMWIIAFVRNSKEFQGLGVNQKVAYES
jgi:hypothetical protein